MTSHDPAALCQRLGHLSAQDLHAIFNDAAISQQWQQDQPTLAQLQLPEQTGGVNPGDQRALYYLIAHLRPKRIFEAGTHLGCSTLNMLLACRHQQRGTPGPWITTVDVRDVNDPERQPWLEYGAKRSPAAAMRAIGKGDEIDFQVGSSIEWLPQTETSFDFMFLDGDHAGQYVKREIPAALTRLKPGGFILLHDFFPEGKALFGDKEDVLYGPFKAVEWLQADGYTFKALSLGDLPWPTKYGGTTTTLALLVRDPD